MNRNPTASGLLRTDRCPAHLALPWVNSTSDSAERGTIGHRFLEMAATVGPDAAIATLPAEYGDWLRSIDLDGLPIGPSCRQEVAFAYDVQTGRARELGTGIQRAYGVVGENEIAGTADVLAKSAAHVYDYKFEQFDNHTEPVATNPQLRALALFAARSMGLDSAEAGIIHIRPDGGHWIETAKFDSFDLDSIAIDLKQTMKRVRDAQAQVARGEVPSVSRGPWCRWCHASSSCPSVTSLVRAVAMEPAKTAQEILALLTPETAAKAYRRLAEVQDALKPVSSALYLYASEHEIDLGDGRVYGAVQSERDEIDGRTARKVLAELHGPEIAEAACDFETSKAAIGRALRQVAVAKKAAGEKTTAKALNDAALDAIRKAGGIKSKTTNTVREHKAGEKAEEAA